MVEGLERFLESYIYVIELLVQIRYGYQTHICLNWEGRICPSYCLLAARQANCCGRASPLDAGVAAATCGWFGVVAVGPLYQ